MTETSPHSKRLAGAKVLVTGGAGFIGSHVIDHLITLGSHVVALDNLSAGTWENVPATDDRFQVKVGDVRDSSAIRDLVESVRPDFVFHLAANASVPRSVDHPDEDFTSNCCGTFVLLNAVRDKCPSAKVIVASSGAVYGEPESLPIHENGRLAPISPYGGSKLQAEISARIFHQVYEVDVVIARIFNCYGPRMARFVILDFLRKLQRDPTRLEVLGSGEQVRDFTYVTDTVQGLALLAEFGVSGQAYNVSSGECSSIRDLAQLMIHQLGLEKLTQIQYTGKSWIGDAQRWEVSNSRMQQLGYSPAISLEEGLRRTAAWYGSANPKIPWSHVKI